MKNLPRGLQRWLSLVCVVVGAAGGCLNPRPEELPSAGPLLPSEPGSPGVAPDTTSSSDNGPEAEGEGQPLPELGVEPSGDEGEDGPADAGVRALETSGPALPTDEPRPTDDVDAGVHADADCAP